MAVGRVVIVGAGPAGAALAYLLARRGVEVALLERHPDFERTFRGDGLQPSGIDAFDQMGLGDRLRQLPRAIINTIDLYQGGRRRARIATESLGFIGCFIPQPAVLAMLTEESRKHPSFQLHMGTAVRDLIRAGDRVVGVRADGPDGPREFPADLVIGTDGRYSTVRKRGAFTELPSPQHFDILNFMVPFPDFWPDRTTVRLELGPGCLTGGIPTADGRLWVGMTIQKGQYKDAAGRRAGRAHRGVAAPHLARPGRAPAGERRSAQAPGAAGCDRRPPGDLDGPRPAAPGGRGAPDVAHRGAGNQHGFAGCPGRRQSPVPGAHARHAAADIDAAARQVAAERMPEIVAIQEHQRKQTQTFLRSDRFSSRLAMRLLPLLAKSSLLRLLLGNRLRSLQHGVVPVRLTA